ncbi:Xylose transport system permease protein XylH [Rhodobacteraceae bacterium THAF1]|uniref:multiple monosaccharide ABC transporter permease n=1 Tax=Palleronia sp. THAF1 TaxID=2587842 RepID=UPI000F4033E6|nr:multiple monosaccharide ABC transporter permease [Palleronia sp. THAF1]QFU08098.1 Xylose transport system permease protein XylH [Palleronia sp. THAF1]VDC27957.1 Xylose transport system permease protein XylH [Rhodobacteraceae bacterium THAF1]
MSDILDTTASEPAGEQARASWRFLKTHLREYGILFALIAIMAFFQIATGGILLKPVNLTNLVLQNSYIVIMAIGMLLVIVAGHIDLSVGSVLGFVGALAAVMIVNWDMHYLIAGILCLGVGALIGAAQGFWIAYFRIPSFIVTLAGMLVFKGLTLWLLAGQSVGPFPAQFQLISSGFLPDLLNMDGFNLMSFIIGLAVATGLTLLAIRNRASQAKTGAPAEPFAFFAAKTAIIFIGITWMSWLMADFRGLPNVFIVMALLIAIYSFVTSRMTVGRRLYAIGGNEKAATLSGINSKRLVFLTFANMGMLAALAGLVFAARLNTATPKSGAGFELDVIAAVFIGGASMAGGVGTVVGAVIGAFIMGVMNNGMSILGIGIDYQQVIKGLVLLAAVIFDVMNKKKG